MKVQCMITDQGRKTYTFGFFSKITQTDNKSLLKKKIPHPM